MRVAETLPETSINPRPRRVYGEAEKSQLFEAFERLGKVSLAAREVGLDPASCYQRLVGAGIDAKQRGRARRTEYIRLRESGVARADAARQVGLNLRTAVVWDQGIEHATLPTSPTPLTELPPGSGAARRKSNRSRDQDCASFVQDKLRIRWSPEQVCHALIKGWPSWACKGWSADRSCRRGRFDGCGT
jgi:hypothetical protein